MNDLLSFSRRSWRKNETEMEEVSLRTHSEGLATSKSDDLLDVEKGNPDENLSAFFKKEQRIRSEISNMQRAIEKLRAMNDEGRTLTSGLAIKSHSTKMEEEMKGVRLIANSIKKMLEDLINDNKLSCAKPGCGKGTSTYKIRQNATEDLRAKLEQRRNSFQELVDKINEDEREVTKRRYITLTGQIPDENIINSLNTPQDRENLLRAAIEGQGKENLSSFLDEMEERAQGISGIIQELLELQSMFLDMSVMVESQGKLLESIDSTVNKTVETVETANKVYSDALNILWGTRKWRCYLFILILVIILVLILVIYLLTK